MHWLCERPWSGCLLFDPDMRKHMGQVALYKVVDFHASTIVPRIEYVYEELILNANLLSEDCSTW